MSEPFHTSCCGQHFRGAWISVRRSSGLALVENNRLSSAAAVWFSGWRVQHLTTIVIPLTIYTYIYIYTYLCIYISYMIYTYIYLCIWYNYWWMICSGRHVSCCWRHAKLRTAVFSTRASVTWDGNVNIYNWQAPRSHFEKQMQEAAEYVWGKNMVSSSIFPLNKSRRVYSKCARVRIILFCNQSDHHFAKIVFRDNLQEQRCFLCSVKTWKPTDEIPSGKLT